MDVNLTPSIFFTKLDCESGRKWTGDEVYEFALNFAYYLVTECLLKPGDIVCFLCADTDTHAIAMLGVWAAGGVYCSLPSHSTYREIDSVLTLINPSFLVTDDHNYGIAATITMEMLSTKKLFLIDEKSSSDLNSNLDIIENILQFERSFLPLPIDGSFSDTCALIVNTSTDGSPRAVIRTNRNLISMATALQCSDSSDLSSDDVVLISGLYSSTGLGMILHSLNSGSTVAICDGNDNSLLSNIEKWGITSALLTTSQLYLYIETNQSLNTLRDVWYSGTTLTEESHKRAQELFGNFRTIFSTPEAGWVTTLSLSEAKSNTNHKTIGRPVAGVDVKLVDSIGQSLPFNTVGEVCVRSHQCSPGYLNNESETNQLSVTDRFIRTGEYGLYDGNGLFYTVGHSEEFIKVNDYMISAEELESILSTHLDIKEAAVICGEDERGSEFVKALVTLRKDFKMDLSPEMSAEEALREFVNLRVDPRKGIKMGGIEIMKDSPHPQMRRFSFRKRVET